jgi:hypothetical protein
MELASKKPKRALSINIVVSKEPFSHRRRIWSRYR